MSMVLGDTLGPYRITEQLGHGGMAQVYKAYHARLARYVAIKVILPHFARETGFRERFEQEAVAVARLQHPNILTVYDFGEERGLAYMVTEFVDGGILSDLTGRPIDPVEVAQLLGPVGSALDYAHGHGVLHRDVKPANILLRQDGTPVLSDFGIARLTDTSRHLTGTGMVMGTPAYQAPEQAQGKPAGPETDQYALAVVAYELLTGQVPYSAETPMAVLLAHLVQPLPLPRSVNPALSEEIETVLLRGLAKQPPDRFPTCAALGAALLQAARPGASATTPPAPSGPPPAVFTRSEPDATPMAIPVPEPSPLQTSALPTVATPVAGTPKPPTELSGTPQVNEATTLQTPTPSVATGSTAPATVIATTANTPSLAAAPTSETGERTEQIALPPEPAPTLAAGFQAPQAPPTLLQQPDAVDTHPRDVATTIHPVVEAGAVVPETPPIQRETPATPTPVPPTHHDGTMVVPEAEHPAVAPVPSIAAALKPGVARTAGQRPRGAPWPLLGGAALALVVLAVALYLFLGRSTSTPASVATPTAMKAASSTAAQPATSPAAAATTAGKAAQGPMPEKRRGQAAITLADGKVLVMGGTGPGGPLASTALYDPTGNSWSAAGKLSAAHGRPAVVLLSNSNVLLVGRDRAELYDPKANTWSPAGSMMATGDFRTATLLKDGKVLVVADNAGERRNTVELYDPASNAWTVAPVTDGAGVDHTATLLGNGKVLVAGRNAAILYDPATNAWSDAGAMRTPRDSHTATLLPNGQVLVIGGVGATGPLATAERYDATKNAWTDAGNMASTREEHAAVTLKDGKILVAGGKGSSGAVAGAERYDPASDAWSAAGSLATPRFGATASLLPNGQVLIAGGDNGSGPLDSVEIFDPATSTWTASK